MERINTEEPAWPAVAVARASACLAAGGVVVAPTETVYGLLTLWDNSDGRERIFTLKSRPREKHLQMLAADLPAAERFGIRADAGVRALARQFWPGPLTIVCRASGNRTVGLRIPDHSLIQAILAAVSVPLAATSANRSGQEPPRAAQDAVEQLEGEPDLVIDAGPCPGTASTVVSLVGPGMRVVREGPVSVAQIEAALGGL